MDANFNVMLGIALMSTASVGYIDTMLEPVDLLPKGFIYVDTKPSNMMPDLRYLTTQNFVGDKIDGYKKDIVILTKEATETLYQAAKIFANNGYKIVIYDAYRPQKAVDHFVR